MLDDADRRRLAEIERGLRAQDPSFAQRLSSATPRLAARWCGISAIGWLLTAILAACLALLLRSGAMSVMALLAVCLSMALWAADENSPR
jgi:hypothetical protein